MFLIGIPVDPDKDAKSKWLFWLVGPLVCTALFAGALYSAVKDPDASDLVSAALGGAFFSYLGFGAGYFRRRFF